MTSLPSLAHSSWISWGFCFAPYSLYRGQTDLHWSFTPLMQMQPQQLHVSSTGLYSLRKPWQLLADQLCKNLALGPGSLHLVPVGGMLYIRQEASNPNFPFRQESVGGLGPSGRARTPSPTAQPPSRTHRRLSHPADSTEKVPAPASSVLRAKRRAEESLQ